MAVAKPDLKCLVADDEPQIGALLREALARQGYSSDVVVDGDQAARKLAEGDYALVVCDVMMPFKTGVELVHELRARRRMIPVVLMSSYLSEEILVSCSAVEHLAFLQKPFALSDLRHAIDRANSSVRC
ncbi:MAG TPA: response regulator [Planctomycetota bacterium]|jgi:DNA-binding response OmpR family regulator|nr:response regulator [Planctomycetota bacterium]